MAVELNYLMIKEGKLVLCFSAIFFFFALLLKSTDYEM